MKQIPVSGALVVLCLSPLDGLGDIAARNREIENAGRLQQGRLDALLGLWRGVQFRLIGANQMLAATRVNEATAMGEASKAIAAKEIANRQTVLDWLEQESKQFEERIEAQVANFTLAAAKREGSGSCGRCRSCASRE